MRRNLVTTTALCGALLFAAPAAFAAGDTPAPTCYLRDQAGNCMDDDALPRTGQFQDLDHFDESGPSPNYSPPSGLANTQHHGNVRLEQATFIFAHNICRFVDNKNTRGKALFIGLGTGDGYQSKNNDPLGREQWLSFINNPPVGAELTTCCKPFTVSLCGQTFNVDFAKAGAPSITIRAGHSAQTIYTCTEGLAGIQATHDSSWIASTSGSCEAPNSGGGGSSGGAGGGDRGGSGQVSHDTDGDGKTDTPGPGGPGQVTKDRAPEEPGPGGGGGQGGSGNQRVICTHFYRKGLMDRSWWDADLRFTMANLSPTTVRGYHYWAIPYVELMRRDDRIGRLAEKVMLPLALHRAEELAHRMGVEGTRPNWKGKLVRLIGEPICYAVGLFVDQKDYQRLYAKEGLMSSKPIYKRGVPA